MHVALINIKSQLELIVTRIDSSIPSDEPFGIVHNNWSFPGLTRLELKEEAQSIIDLIDAHGGDDVGHHEVRLRDYERRLVYLQSSTIPQIWGNAGQAVPAFMLTMDGLRKALSPVLQQDNHLEAAVKLRKLAQQIRGLEAKLNKLNPRTTDLVTMVERIEDAYHAADQLPTDLESLSEARADIEKLVKAAEKDTGHIESIREHADKLDQKLQQSNEEAESVLERCETAYSASTSVGLAAAFSERSKALSGSMWLWVVGLVVALSLGSFFGSKQLSTLSELFKTPDVSMAVVALNLLLSLLSVGAPIWFSWLATKQIGQRFKLAEDYAFKASISRAYEGFRREAARFDKDMEAKLLTSALTRLDELPLRLVENTNHGSPWHELASSELVTQAIKTVPGFAEQVKNLAGMAINTVKPQGKKPASSATAKADDE
ncbi:TPA: hypothetical protein ACSPZQ_001008 [Aeromonas veronii]